MSPTIAALLSFSVISFLVGLGFQVSGFTSLPLAIVLWILAAILAVAAFVVFLRNRSKPEEETTGVKGNTPHISPNMSITGRDITVGGDFAGRDIDKSTHITQTELITQPISPILDGVFRGPNILIKIQNMDSLPHQFRARLHSVDGGVPGSPNGWLDRGWWLKWDSASNSEWESIGPKQDGMIHVATKGGSTDGQSRTIKFNCVNATDAEARRLYTNAPWDGEIRCAIEIQSDAQLAEHGKQTWVLALKGGTPTAFTRSK